LDIALETKADKVVTESNNTSSPLRLMVARWTGI